MTEQELFVVADNAGKRAVEALRVEPMVVRQHSNMFDDNSPVLKEWVVPGGPCGFGWVNIKPAHSKFAKWMLNAGLATKDSYNGGICYWIRDYGQSMQMKEAYVYAFASTLHEHGILKVYAGSRMD